LDVVEDMLCVLKVVKDMLCMLKVVDDMLCVLKVVEDMLYLLEAWSVLKLVEVLDVMLLYAINVGGCVLCAGGNEGCVPFAVGA
jgi:hypothetical protein